jgi:hypothetical protein
MKDYLRKSYLMAAQRAVAEHYTVAARTLMGQQFKEEEVARTLMEQQLTEDEAWRITEQQLRHSGQQLTVMEQYLKYAATLTIKTALLQDWRSSRPVSLVSLPTAAQFGLVLLSRQRRDDVLNDLCDWVEQDGRFNAKCWLRLTSALFGQLLDVLYRIGEVVGKFRGAK